VKRNEGEPRRALITGGANGFGLATARALLDRGGQVTIGDVDTAQLETAQRSLHSDRVLARRLDVTSPDSVKAAVAATVAEFGGLDTLVNCAGIISFKPFLEIEEDDWDRVIDVDLKGTFLSCQAAAPALCASGRGRIVNIGSDASKMGWPVITSYVAAKFGVVGLTKSIAGDLAAHNVTVNCVCPIATATTGMGQLALDWKMDRMGASPQEVAATTAAAVPLRRNCTEADVINAIMFFIDDASGFLTGQALDVDGGMLSTAAIAGSRE
jgi:meso-butanediol dehydrogenase/(S,S)-butanediol dehydrogenase/diacetyl reductase